MSEHLRISISFPVIATQGLEVRIQRISVKLICAGEKSQYKFKKIK